MTQRKRYQRGKRMSRDWQKMTVATRSLPDGRSRRPPGRARVVPEYVVILVIFLDFFVICGTGIGASDIVEWSGLQVYAGTELGDQIDAIVFYVITFAVFSRVIRLYAARKIFALGDSLMKAAFCYGACFAVLMIFAAAAKITQIYSRLWFFSWFVLAFGGMFLFRLTLLMFFERAFARGGYVSRAYTLAVFCDAPNGADFAHDRDRRVRSFGTARIDDFDAFDAASEAIRQLGIDVIFVRTPWARAPEVAEQLARFDHLAADVVLVPEERRIGKAVESVENFGGEIALRTMSRPIKGWNVVAKRFEDVCVSAAALVVLSPLMVLIGLAIRLESRGPVFFRQVRTGFNGETFVLWKFRSMRAGETDAHAERQTARADARVTRVGALIRRTSLDELPQFFNVLIGNMSVVGPRPHALKTTAEGESLDSVVTYYAARFRVKPGITGLAQVNGFRGELDAKEKVRRRVDFDMEYIRNWSLLSDVRIMLKTARLLINDPYAY